MYVFASTILFYEAYFVKCVRRACYKNIWDIHLPFQMLSSESLCLILKFRRKLNFNSLSPSRVPFHSLCHLIYTHVFVLINSVWFFHFRLPCYASVTIPHLRFFWFAIHSLLAHYSIFLHHDTKFIRNMCFMVKFHFIYSSSNICISHACRMDFKV